MKYNSLIDVLDKFPDEKSCIQHLEKLRWPSESPNGAQSWNPSATPPSSSETALSPMMSPRPISQPSWINTASKTYEACSTINSEGRTHATASPV